MTHKQHILVIDASTSSISAFAFDLEGQICAQNSLAFTQHLPRDGWVEHDAQEIWEGVLKTGRAVVAQIKEQDKTAIFIGMGLTNQRESVLLWERENNTPLHRAIVWQDRRTADMTDGLRDAGHEAMISARTGLLLDPYFSASKIAWMLDHIDDARMRVDSLACGTIDSWLIWKLTGGAHYTDATNAARTSLFNIHENKWDSDLCALFDIPPSILPEVRDCADDFGVCDAAHFGVSMPLLGVMGDQQAAAFGQTCFHPAMIKATYGTGCFMLAHTGVRAAQSHNRLLTTIAWRLDGELTYALEGSIFMSGAIMQWLRDCVHLIDDVSESEALAKAANLDSRVILVPALTGLGAPHWQPHARGAFLNMTQSDGRAEMVRAALMSVSLQSRDLIDAMAADMDDAGLAPPDTLRVDGGMVANGWFMQNLADMTGCVCRYPQITETTALGVAYLVMLKLGVHDMDALQKLWKQAGKTRPMMDEGTRAAIYASWTTALQQIIAATKQNT